MKGARVFIIITIIFSFISCTHDTLVPIEEFDTICFESQILPIFQTGCAISSCHSSGASESGLVFSDYESIIKSITPGDPYQSKAYQSIIAKWGENAMPPDRPLSETERTLIRIWIEQGAPKTFCDNGSVETPTDTSVCFTVEVLPILLSSCSTTDCHDAGSHKEGLVLDSYNNVMRGGEENLVIAGDPNRSKLYTVLNESGEERMPPSPYEPLTETQKQIIYDWINEGAENLDCTDNCDPFAYSFASVIAPMIENNCRGCHSGTSPNGGITLNSYADIKAIADNGLLVDVVKGTNGRSLMPPSNSLSSCQITQLENWIANGSLND